MPDLLGVLETSLYVDAFERACPFYEQVLGLNSIYRDARLCAYDVGGRGVLLLFLRGRSLAPSQICRGRHDPPHDGRAWPGPDIELFRKPIAARCARAAGEGAGLPTPTSAIEGRTKWPRGGESIYFLDPDGHVLELATPGLWPGY